MTTTDRLTLPLIAAGQAQKEMTHNEALAALDIAVQPVVEAVGVDVPPPDPLPGQCWIVGTAPGGAWAGRAQALAGWTLSGWRFVTPRTGWSAWAGDTGRLARFDGTGWAEGVLNASRIEIDGVRVVATQQEAIEMPVGGSVTDIEARAAISSVISALRAHGLIGA